MPVIFFHVMNNKHSNFTLVCSIVSLFLFLHNINHCLPLNLYLYLNELTIYKRIVYYLTYHTHVFTTQIITTQINLILFQIRAHIIMCIFRVRIFNFKLITKYLINVRSICSLSVIMYSIFAIRKIINK